MYLLELRPWRESARPVVEALAVQPEGSPGYVLPTDNPWAVIQDLLNRGCGVQISYRGNGIYSALVSVDGFRQG